MRLKTPLLLILLFIFHSVVSGQAENTTIAQIQKAIKNADATGLAAFFHSTVDLEVADTDGNYSKNQAEMILRDFFQNNPVKSFTMRHQGSSDDGSKYLIGTYKTMNDQEFRVYVLIKGTASEMMIHQLQFEKD
jgi:hypothetical protein